MHIDTSHNVNPSTHKHQTECNSRKLWLTNLLRRRHPKGFSATWNRSISLFFHAGFIFWDFWTFISDSCSCQTGRRKNIRGKFKRRLIPQRCAFKELECYLKTWGHCARTLRKFDCSCFRNGSAHQETLLYLNLECRLQKMLLSHLSERHAFPLKRPNWPPP